MVKEVPSCEMCKYSMRDYMEYKDRSGKIRRKYLVSSGYVRCFRVRELLRNKDSDLPVRVPNYFAYCCPFFRHRYGHTKVLYKIYDEIDLECIEYLYVAEYGINSIPMEVLFACANCGNTYKGRLKICVG